MLPSWKHVLLGSGPSTRALHEAHALTRLPSILQGLQVQPREVSAVQAGNMLSVKGSIKLVDVRAGHIVPPLAGEDLATLRAFLQAQTLRSRL